MRDKNNRPIFLNLFKIHFPMAAINSILHRVSGLGLFLSIPILLYGLEQSLSNEQSFIQIQALLNTSCLILLSCLLVWGFVQHALSGIRFLLLDAHIGDERLTANRSALWINILSVVITASYLVWRL